MGIRRWLQVGGGAALVLLLLGLGPPRAWAAGPSESPRDKFRGGNTITIPANETVAHDLYVAGGTVRIEGRIDGDLFVAGGTVDVSGPVAGDLFASGGTITISSSVERHLRVAGGNLTISGPVRQDVLAAVGTLTITTAARIGGDLIFTAGQTALDGSVDGSVLGSAQSYTKAGTVRGSEEVSLRQEQQTRERREPSAASVVLDQMRRYLSIVFFGALLLWLTPRIIQGGATRTRERFFPSLGAGLLTFIAFFVVLVALFIATLVLAVPLGLLGFGRLVLTLVLGVFLGTGAAGFLLILVMLFVAAAIVGLALGRLVLAQVAAPWAERPYVAMLLGVLIIVILTAIPYLGWVLDAIVVLLGLGGLILNLSRPGRAPATASPPAPLQ